MEWPKAAVLIALAALLAVPFVLRPERASVPADARSLIIITPHNEQIRSEFGRAFDEWHAEQYGERVNVIWNAPGGTTEMRRMLEAQYAAALEAGREPGGAADLMFGGGSYEHEQLKRPILREIGAETRLTTISVPVDFDESWLEHMYGPNEIGDGRLYDPEKHWFGTALSGFGIISNLDALAEMGVPRLESWVDLADPRLRGWVALVNPGQSGSITTAFTTILQRLGWEEGWRILRRAAANARYFSASASRVPIDVSMGEAAAGVCIDFYGRFQEQAVEQAGTNRIAYVDPPGVTTIDADPISMLRGAPHPELARRFIEFTLSEQGQALWQFRAGPKRPGQLGPVRFELRRLPALRSMYDKRIDQFIDRVNPFELVRAMENADFSVRAFVPIVFSAMAMDVHDELVEAWNAIVTHPGYPATSEIVTAADVSDSDLRAMLELFDAMPSINALPDCRGGGGGLCDAVIAARPGCANEWSDDCTRVLIELCCGERATSAPVELSLATEAHLGWINTGWLRGGWRACEFWPAEARPADEMRRRFADEFRRNYRRIVAIAEGR